MSFVWPTHLENITDKNPANMRGQTPKRLVIENRHEEIGELIDDDMSSCAMAIQPVYLDGLAYLNLY